jgi:transglutaminase-like putative cysteine protease
MHTYSASSDSATLMHRATRPMSRDKADALLLLAACLTVLAPHVAHLPTWATIVSATLLLWRTWITFRGNRMPSRWILLPIAALAMGGVYWTYRTFFGQEAGVTMLVLLLAFKLLEMRAKRDLFVIVFLSFFLMLASFIYSQTIAAAVMMVAAVVLMLTAQLSFQYTGTAPPLKRRLALGVLIVALAIPLTLVLFILFPRIQGPLWGLPGDAHSSQSGLSDSMAPGNISNLALSGEIAFRAKFADRAPPTSSLYWRGPVFGNYDGRTWTALQLRRDFSQPVAVTPRGTPIRYQVTLEPNGRRALFALEMPLIAPTIANNPSRLSADLQILTRKPIGQRIRYDAESYIEFELQPNVSDAVLREWLALPSGYNPLTLELAAQLRSHLQSDTEAVNAILKFFRQEKFSYTLEPPLLGEHAVDDFLFSTRAGFCEHYASAFVVLMRALGVPARVVTGYQGGEINTVDGFMTVRQSDAHAWAEVWLKNRGWTRVDPTAAVAPERIEQSLTRAVPPRLFGGLIKLDGSPGAWVNMLRGVRHNWDAMTNAWNQKVLNYTPDRQRSLVQSLGFDNVDWRTLTGLMFVLGTVVMAAITLPLMRNRQKRNPVDRLYQALCLRMARRGCAPAIHEGPRAYATRLTSAASPLTQTEQSAAAGFLELYESIRYGSHDAGKMSQKSSSALVSKLKSLLAECK